MLYKHWDDSFSLGHPTLDDEHKRMFGMLEEIEAALNSQNVGGTARQFLERLVDYREDDLHTIFGDVSHCSHEHAIWLQEHRAEHHYLANRARAFMAFPSNDEHAELQDLYFILSRWLTDHIQSNQRTLQGLLSSGVRN